MESEKLSKDKNNDNQNNISNDKLKNIKSNFILSKIYGNLEKKKKLDIVKYNKKLQNRLNLNIKNYEECSSIKIEIIPTKDKYGRFINLSNKVDRLYYHIFFNDNEEEIKNKYEIKKEDKVERIKIIIDYQVKSFKNLFYECTCIESINFKNFYRNNVIDMSGLFFGCSSLKEINFSNFKTDNVKDMSFMFYGCSSLKEINLSNFKTNNVKDMSFMFNACSSLKKINLFNIYTSNVTNMSYMFYGCS